MLNKLFKKKKSLRERCQEKYGDDFIKLYDKICNGETVGNLEETKKFIRMVEAIKEE